MLLVTSLLPYIYLITQAGDLARENDMPLHMDGARLMNAAVAMAENPKAILQHCQSSSICFSKGLGTPVGSVIVGSDSFIQR